LIKNDRTAPAPVQQDHSHRERNDPFHGGFVFDLGSALDLPGEQMIYMDMR
jgi:hypothetical protein